MGGASAGIEVEEADPARGGQQREMIVGGGGAHRRGRDRQHCGDQAAVESGGGLEADGDRPGQLVVGAGRQRGRAVKGGFTQGRPLRLEPVGFVGQDLEGKQPDKRLAGQFSRLHPPKGVGRHVGRLHDAVFVQNQHGR